MADNRQLELSFKKMKNYKDTYPIQAGNGHGKVAVGNQQYQSGYMAPRYFDSADHGTYSEYQGVSFANNALLDRPLPSIEVPGDDEYLAGSQEEVLDDHEYYPIQQDPILVTPDPQQCYEQQHRTGFNPDAPFTNQPTDLGHGVGGTGVLEDEFESAGRSYYQDPVSGKVYPRSHPRGLGDGRDSTYIGVSSSPNVEIDLHNMRPAGQSSFFQHSIYGDSEVYPSRYSGGDENWGINSQPATKSGVSAKAKIPMSKANMKKRGIEKASVSKDGFKRGYGANDPENLRIMDLFENEQDGKLLKWPEIAAIINKERIKSGKQPGLTANAAQNRYNRTAPVIYASEGRAFVPLRKRERAGKTCRKQGGVQYAWTLELDELLVTIVKEYEAQKWGEVAKRYNIEAPRRLPDPKRNPIDGDLAAIRYKML